MNLLDLESEKFKDVEVKGYKFKIRHISPMDRVQVTHQRIRLQDGNPVETMTEPEFYYFENIAIVNVCTEEMPKEKVFKKNESCVKWPDIELINELAGEIRNHTNDIEEELKKNRPGAGGVKE